MNMNKTSQVTDNNNTRIFQDRSNEDKEKTVIIFHSQGSYKIITN